LGGCFDGYLTFWNQRKWFRRLINLGIW